IRAILPKRSGQVAPLGYHARLHPVQCVVSALPNSGATESFSLGGRRDLLGKANNEGDRLSRLVGRLLHDARAKVVILRRAANLVEILRALIRCRGEGKVLPCVERLDNGVGVLRRGFGWRVVYGLNVHIYYPS